VSGGQDGEGRGVPPEREGFLADDWSEARPGPAPGGASRHSTPPRRRPAFSVSPIVAALALAAIAWLLWGLWPDVAYFLSSKEPIDLGAPAAYHLERAVPNRLCRIVGAPVASVRGIESRGGAERRVVGLLGVNLVVDGAGGAGPATVYEGRLLPVRRSTEYAPFVDALKQRGWRAGEGWLVLRDGDRPRRRWGRPLLSVVLLALGALNLKALSRAFIG
jgi:hypothetical protein